MQSEVRDGRCLFASHLLNHNAHVIPSVLALAFSRLSQGHKDSRYNLKKALTMSSQPQSAATSLLCP